MIGDTSNLENTIRSIKKELDADTAKLNHDTAKLNRIDSIMADSTKELNSLRSKIADQEADLIKQKDSLEVIAEISLKDSLYMLKDDWPIKYKKKRKVYRFGKRKAYEMDEIYDAVHDNDKPENTTVLKKDTIIQITFHGKENQKKHSDSSCRIEAQVVKIKQVRMVVKEGLINDIIVQTDHGIFRNKENPIELSHFNDERKQERLSREGEASPYFIFMGDVIDYLPIRPYTDLPYSEFNITLIPDVDSLKRHSTYLIKEGTSINSYFDVAIYSDIKGISGDANGLAQVNGTAKFITNTDNIRNSPIIPLHFLDFEGGIAKFDNNFKGTPLSTKDSVNRKDLFQRAYYNLGVKLNAFHWVESPYPHRSIDDIQINIGYNFIGSRIINTYHEKGDTIAIDTIYNTAIINQIFIEPIFSFSRHKNFNMSLGLPFYVQNIKASSRITNREFEWWICPSISLMYYSKRNPNNKLFFRYNHFINLTHTDQAFIQMQLGYSVNLTDLLSSHNGNNN